MWQTLIAVLGTLAGVAITSGYQAMTARRDRDAARRAEGLAAVTTLIEALANHRRAMWVREDLRLRGEDWDDARTESHATRAAVTAPLLRVQLLLPTLAPAAQAAARASFALRGAAGRDVLDNRRSLALTASDELVAAAGQILAEA